MRVNAPIYCAPFCSLGTGFHIYNFRFWGRKIFHLDFWRQWLSIVPFFNIRNGDLGPTLFLIFKVLLLQQRAVAKSGVHVSQREELWSSLSLYFKTDFLWVWAGRRDDKGIGQRHLSSHRRSGPNLRKGCLALPKGVKCKWQSPVPRKSPLYCSI